MKNTKNITLIHCYSDFNKGDLGIILSTINNLREVYPNAKINAISTYNYNDSQYRNDHKILSQYVDNIYPCIFGLLFINYSDKEYKGGLAKLIKFFKECLRLGSLLFLPRGSFFYKTLLNKHEKESFQVLMESDIIISKGGSFICNENNFRSKVAYMRLMYIFLLLKKYKIGYYIFGQSLGPVYGKLSRYVLTEVLKGSKKTYLREDTCLIKYPYISKEYCSDVIVNDTAFTLTQNEPIEFLEKEAHGTLRIGFTLKYLGSADQQYTEMILTAMKYLIDTFNAEIFVFPQVTVDRDIEKSKAIYMKIDDRYKRNIQILSNNYTPYQLRYGYSKMKLLIGTRLHSTIFAMSAKVPAINIAYHGTKSQGIYKNMGVEELVVGSENFNNTYLIELINKVLENHNHYTGILNSSLIKTKETIVAEISKMNP